MKCSGALSLLILVCLTMDGFTQLAEGKDVRRVLELAPAEENPRNSEGDFVALRDGRILFVYTHFTGGARDDAKAHLASRVSADGGLIWSEKDEVIPTAKAGQNVMSVSLLRLGEREVALFYLLKNSLTDCRMYVQSSGDEGRTWGTPRLCMTEEGYFVVNNDRVIRLKGERLVIPAAHHAGSTQTKFNARATAVCFLSDDEGKSWRRAKSAIEGPAASRTGLQEPAVVELKDGRLMMLCRTDQGCQMRSYSADGGETWSAAQRTEIRSPVSPASVGRVPKTGDLLLVWNDNDGKAAPGQRANRRSPLTAAISGDEGATWRTVGDLETDRDGWFCYTAVEFVGEDRVLLAYCAGKRAGDLGTTRITVVPVSWLYAAR
jgi:sialidase-1